MTEPASFDTWTIIFLLAALHGFVMAGLLFLYKQGNKKANNILACVIILFAVSMVYYVMYWTRYAMEYTWMNNWVDAVPFLYGPLLLRYLQVLNNTDTVFKWKWHLLPFILHTLFRLPFLIRELADKPQWLREYFFIPMMPYLNNLNLIFIIAQCCSLLIYTLAMFRLLGKNKNTITIYAIRDEISKHRWMQNIVIFFTVFALSTISYWLLVFAGWLKVEYDYALSVIMSVFIYMVGYLGFRQPAIFTATIPVEEIQQEKNIDILPLVNIKATEAAMRKYKNSSLKAEQAFILKEKLLELMHNEKCYCDNTLKMQDIAIKLEVSTHHLSQVINELCGQTWSDFITDFRIQEAKQLLSDPDYADKILAIAFDCGFNNKATFNTAFKKNTGMAPSAYRKMALTKATG